MVRQLELTRFLVAGILGKMNLLMSTLMSSAIDVIQGNINEVNGDGVTDTEK